MKRFGLTTSEKMLLELLKAALHEQSPDDTCFQRVLSDDWYECCKLAVRQGVVVLAWDGIVKLPENLLPPQDLKISWAIAVEKYEKRYMNYCDIVYSLSAFYMKHDILMAQLKGVGLSVYYPQPSHREGGDIDIYTYSANLSKYTDEAANRRADSLMQAHGIEVDSEHNKKHSLFYCKGIPIENHKTFLDVDRSSLAKQVEELLKQSFKPQYVELPNGKQILIPSSEFNTLFVAFHAASHYGAGISLHHLCDWACIIKRYGLCLPAELTDSRFLESVYALTHLCNRYLGTSVHVRGGEKMASEMLDVMLHPFDMEAFPESGTWKYLKFKFKRFLYVVRTNNRIFHIPLWRNPAFWKKLRKTVIWHFSSPKRFLNQ